MKNVVIMIEFYSYKASYKAIFWFKLCLIACFSILALGFLKPANAQSSDPSPYCNVDDDCNGGFDPQINSVSIGNFTNNSGGCNISGDVTYFDNLGAASLTAGQSYTASIEVDGTFFDKGSGIWIDFNKNEQFEPDEYFGPGGTVGAGTQTQTFQVNIPSNAKCGITRMRVKVDEDNVPQGSPCDMVDFDGEVEDYNVDIQPASPKNDVAVGSILSPDANKDSYGIETLKVILNNASKAVLPAGTTIPFKLNTTILSSPRKFTYTTNRDLGPCGLDTVNLGIFSLACNSAVNVSVSTNWSKDINNNNDTTNQLFFTGDSTVVNQIDFESGSVPSGVTINGGAITSNDGPRGDFHFVGSGGGPNFVQFELDLNKLDFPFLSFYTKDINFPEVEGPDGMFISVDGGQTFVKITDLDIGENNSYTQKNFDIRKVLSQNGLSVPSNGKIIIRLSQDDTINSEAVAYDDIVVFNYNIAQPVPKPNQVLIAPDTVFVNSPTKFQSVSKQSANLWSVGGKILDSATSSFETSYPAVGMDSIRLISAGCFGVDTSKKVFAVVKPPKRPEANFISDANFVDTNTVVQFLDQSTIGPTKWRWTISPQRVNGDSSFKFLGSNTQQDPKVRFQEPGVYTVTLEVGNSKGFDTAQRKDYIVVGNGYKICMDQMSPDERGLLFDPAGPDAYNDDTVRSCTFTINPACTDSVVATLNALEIAGETCEQGKTPDYLKIFDGTSTNGKPLHTQKGFSDGLYEGNAPNLPVKFTGNSGALTIQFSTNGCNSSEDFNLSWRSYQSAGSQQKMLAQKPGIEGPDTIFIGGFRQYKVVNGSAQLTYRWLMPGFSTVETNDTASFLPFKNVEPGMDTLKLVNKVCGYADTVNKQVFLKEPKRRPIADFTATKTKAKVGDTIQMIDLSRRGVNEWEWSFKPSAPVEFVKNTGSGNRSPYVVVQNPGKYRVDLIVTNKVGQRVEAKINFLDIVENCQPSVIVRNADLGINGVAIDEINQGPVFSNVSGYDSAGFGKFETADDIALEAGKSYEITLSRNTSFNNFSVGGWIDLDKDGLFERSERIFSTQNVSGTQYVDTFTVPFRQDFEGKLNLRIGTNLANSALSGCGPHQSGEFEEYAFTYLGDTTKPVVTLKGGDTLNVDVCNPSTADTGATAMDIVSGNLSGNVKVQNAQMISKPGMHLLTYYVEDESGNRATKKQVIDVAADTVSPALSLKGSSLIRIPFGTSFTDPGFNVSDACGVVDTVKVMGEVKPDIVGTYTIRYKAIDMAGNDSVVTRTISVFDSIPPEGELVGSDTVRVNVFGEYNENGVNVSDNYKREPVMVRIKGSVNTDSVGVYSLVYNLIDADSNVTQLRRIVIVEDLKAPDYIGVPEDAIVLDVNDRITEDLFEVNDNFYDRSKLTLNRNGDYFRNFKDGVADSLGTFNARFTYTDGSGNTSTAAFGVKVVDRVAPSINIQPTVVNLPRFREFNDSLGKTYTISDNHYADTAIDLKRTGTYFTGYIDEGFPRGLFEIRYQAIDPSGNASEEKVRGIDVKAPATGIEDGEKAGTIDVYPNPTDGLVQISLSGVDKGPVRIQVINAKGQTVKSLERRFLRGHGDYRLDLSQEPKGLYKIKLQTRKSVNVKSVIVQ